VDESGLEFLKELDNLKELTISGPIGELGLQHISMISSLKALYIFGEKLSDNAILPLESLNHLESLTIAEIQHELNLPELPQLRKLELRHTGGGFSGRTLSPRMQPRLERLSLAKCSIDANGLGQIGKMQNIERLEFFQVEFAADRGDSFQGLQQLSNLKALSFSYSNVHDRDIKLIAQAQSLESLDLLFVDVTGAALSSLDEHPQLAVLNVGGNDMVLEKFPFVPKLRMLDTQSCQIPPASLRTIASLPILERLTIGNSEVSWNVVMDIIPQMNCLVTLVLSDENESNIRSVIEEINLMNPSLFVGGSEAVLALGFVEEFRRVGD